MPAGEAGTCTEVAQQHAAQVDANQDALAKQIEAVAQKKAEELAKAKKGELRRPPVTRAVTRPPMTTPMVMAPRREDRREGGHKKTANERRSPFHPLSLVLYCIVQYAEVYNGHPREFVFDALGRYVPTSAVVPSFVARHSRVGEATAHNSHQPDSLLSPCGVRSQEEECKYSSGRLGMSRQAQSLGTETDRCTVAQTSLRRKQSVMSGLKPPSASALIPPTRSP